MFLKFWTDEECPLISGSRTRAMMDSIHRANGGGLVMCPEHSAFVREFERSSAGAASFLTTLTDESVQG